MKVKIVKAKVKEQKVNCCLEPGFLGISMCTDKLLKKIDGKISRKLTSEKKDSKFVREEITAPLELAIILIIFTSNVINNNRLSNYESITILIKVLVEKYDPKIPNYILLDNNWFYRRNNHGIQMYLPEIVTDAKNTFVRTTLHIKDLNTSDLIISDSNSDSSSTSSSEIEAIHKTEGVRKCPILKHKVKRKA
ncbi:3457_t:CDS:2 [Ambispora leptoticha]|uniref:3457_t:CDS:1 n=1 Tax=Ambispora leptoticha TaxID=144679 RepID=A0A9N8WFU7_9GLOM|nr:3457_t:CDS:2 [Ambispora leptoticha]